MPERIATPDRGGKARGDGTHGAQGHRARLRDKFLRLGGEALTDEEVLELLLTFGTPRRDCKQQAREALRRFGGLARVMDASMEELRRIKGIGPKNAMAVAFVRHAANRYLKQRIEGGDYIRTSNDMRAYLVHRLRGLEREVFLVVFLDAAHSILDSEILFQGSITSSRVYIREVVRAALERNAAALVVAHNHPSGETRPSEQDLRLTKHLFTACRFMEITLLDHFIVGRDRVPLSFADQGLMEEAERFWKLIRQ